MNEWLRISFWLHILYRSFYHWFCRYVWEVFLTNLKSRIMRACEYELDDHGSEWAKGIANEHQRLRPLIEALAESPVAIERFIKASTVTFDGQEKTSEWKDEWECARSGLDKAIANLERVVGGEG